MERKERLERELNTWIRQYVADQENPPATCAAASLCVLPELRLWMWKGTRLVPGRAERAAPF